VLTINDLIDLLRSGAAYLDDQDGPRLAAEIDRLRQVANAARNYRDLEAATVPTTIEPYASLYELHRALTALDAVQNEEN
jgi:hypothetical protein